MSLTGLFILVGNTFATLIVDWILYIYIHIYSVWVYIYTYVDL